MDIFCNKNFALQIYSIFYLCFILNLIYALKLNILLEASNKLLNYLNNIEYITQIFQTKKF